MRSKKAVSMISYFVPTPCKQFLRTMFGYGSRASKAAINMSDLPYSLTLREFEESGKILKRENIYGSGPPSPAVSAEVLHYVCKYAGQRVLAARGETGFE